MFRKTKRKSSTGRRKNATATKSVAARRSAALNTAPTEAHTRTRILDSALEQFGARGFTATSVRDLATAAGVNVAAINYYFGSKEGLANALLNVPLSRMVENL